MVVATGWHPYPLEKLPELGGGHAPGRRSPTSRWSAWPRAGGPTGGKILRPSNGEAPKRVAFVQCAGSRDVNHLAYCSAVCCLASLKQALYVQEQIPEAEVTIYYIDRRTPGRNEDAARPGSPRMEGVAPGQGQGRQGRGRPPSGDLSS